MKATLAVLLLGFAALVVQGALARTIPPPWCPDLALLVVIGVGLRWPGFLAGLLIAVPLGYAMDLLSGSLMGQHAFMRLVTYMIAAVASRTADTIIVSNEVGLGIVPADATTRRYRDLLGRVNQEWVAAADRAYLMVAGRALPLTAPEQL